MLPSLTFTRLALAAAVFTLAMGSLCAAEPEDDRNSGRPPRPSAEGRRHLSSAASRFSPLSPVRLASVGEIQKELDLSGDQKQQIEEINKRLHDGFRRSLHEGRGSDALRELHREASTDLADVLGDDQEKRLRGIAIQVIGPSVVIMDRELADELRITDEQRSQLREVLHENMRAVSEVFRKNEMSRKERHEKFAELRDGGRQRLLEVLSSEQQEQLRALEGDKVKIDMRVVYRGGFRDRHRDDRDRSNRESENRDFDHRDDGDHSRNERDRDEPRE